MWTVGRSPRRGPRTPGSPGSGSGEGRLGKFRREGSPRLTPLGSPGRASGTSRPPRRALLRAGCRRPAPRPPRGPSLLSAEGPPQSLAAASSRVSRATVAAALRAPPPPSQPRLLVGRSQSWRRNSAVSRQACPMSAAFPPAPPTSRGFRAKCKDPREAGVQLRRLRSVVGSVGNLVSRARPHLCLGGFFKCSSNHSTYIN